MAGQVRGEGVSYGGAGAAAGDVCPQLRVWAAGPSFLDAVFREPRTSAQFLKCFFFFFVASSLHVLWAGRVFKSKSLVPRPMRDERGR